MPGRFATAPSRPRTRPIADEPEFSRFRRFHVAVFGIAVANFVAYLMDFTGEAVAFIPIAILAGLGSILYLALLLQRFTTGAAAPHIGRAVIYLSALYVFGVLFLLSRLGASWPFGAELALNSVIWSVTVSGTLMALVEPARLAAMLDEARGDRD